MVPVSYFDLKNTLWILLYKYCALKWNVYLTVSLNPLSNCN